MRDIEFLLETYEGREFLMDLMEETGTLGDPYWTGEHKDYACGKKAIGLDLLHIILQTDNSSYKVMLDEKKQRDEQEELKNERNREREERELHGDIGSDEDDGDNGSVESCGYYLRPDEKGS